MVQLRRYLITGASGQLGTELCRQLGEAAMPKTREAMDITDTAHLESWLPSLNPLVVINCAAINKVDKLSTEGDQEKCWRTNTLGAANLMKLCSKLGIQFMQLSCSRVFGMDSRRVDPYQEQDVVGPFGFVGGTKCAAETAILRTADEIVPTKKSFRYWILRTSGLFERPWRNYTNLPMYMIDQFRARSSLSVTSKNITNITYAVHLAKLIKSFLAMREDIPSGTYHATNEGQCSYFSIANKLSTATKLFADVSPTISGDTTIPKFCAMDTRKIARIPDLWKMPTWEEALEEYSKEWRKL